MTEDFLTSIGTGIYSINTGDWRVVRPVKDDEKCNRCGLCFLYCPVFSIQKKGRDYVIDLDYCKGCGICAKECPKGAIAMVPEGGK